MSKGPFVITLAAVGAALMALSVVGKSDEAVRSETLEKYCTGVAVWQAAAARGVPPERRAGQPDYKSIAAESCPGLRPAK